MNPDSLIVLTEADTNQSHIINLRYVTAIKDGQVYFHDGTWIIVKESLDKIKRILSIAGIPVVS
ncbi:MAG: hypothetical protein K1X68_10795 [Saprospiraceae bacterium]|nr:hypothetical protein [Saprospiraceae bacterium]HMW40282.1 hypothetical protein [Saprospiraceae bacterium]HMX87269.1 hypothetical protein [Saprospiraceae bacterium]HMZ40752.1 hypothetical protein [Saprospiraceae bacterium]HNA64896.1 hypothetical protein [Saprospiraceae bacterium]